MPRKRKPPALAERRLLGARVVAVRPLNREELAREAWPDSYLNVSIAFDNGDVLYASADSEHNQQGCLVLVPSDSAIPPANLYARSE